VTSSSSSSKSRDRNRSRDLLLRIWPSLFFVTMFAAFAIAAWVKVGANMLGVRSVQGILLFTTLILLLAAAETFVILTAGIDLSVGFILGFASVTSAVAMRGMANANWPAVIVVVGGLFVAVAIGAVSGLANGLLVAKVGVPSFIATLGMGGVVFGLALLAAGGSPVAGLPSYVGKLGNSYVFSEQRWIPYQVVATAVVIGAVWFILAKTQFGRHVYAFGGNAEAAKRAGIKVDVLNIKVYTLAGMLAGFGGLLFTLRFATGNARAGETLLLTSIAAVVIGGASLFGGEGRMFGTIMGALTVATIDFGLVILGVEPYWQWIAVGLVVILSVIVDQMGAKQRANAI
jgi:ribose transport system permease protein